MFKDKELREALMSGRSLTPRGTRLDLLTIVCGETIKGLDKSIETQAKRISELEAKLEAALELLNIKHEPAHNEPAKLVKGKSSVQIGKTTKCGSHDLKGLLEKREATMQYCQVNPALQPFSQGLARAVYGD